MLPLDYAPMEMRLVAQIPSDAGWLYEPKWDGFRALVFCSGDSIEMQSKAGQSLGRYFPEILEALHALDLHDCVLDGELIIDVDGVEAFDALQQRIHPALSRIRRLAAETPARYMVFDVLQWEKRRLVDEPLAIRRALLEDVAGRFGQNGTVRLSPATSDVTQATRWYQASGSGALDGVVAKRLDREYASGERTAAVKIKRIRTADCVVGGFRFAAGNKNAVGSLLLGLYDENGLLDYVGYTSAFAKEERQKLVARLAPLHAASSFTGRAPGGPSRWNRNRDRDTAWQPLRPELVVEVSFDQVTSERFRHGTRLLRWRTDKKPRACALDQITGNEHS